MKKIDYTPEDLTNHEGVGILIKNNEGKILMQDHVKYGFWTIPVGKIKPKQSIVEGLKQELFEECDIIPEEYTEIASKKYIYKRNEKEVIVNIHLFEITKYLGEIINKEPQKHRKQEFAEISTIKKFPFLSDATPLYLESIGFKRKKRLE